jgi:putative Ca2+/H+ antiporter (TMEM165/GDT1 family)
MDWKASLALFGTVFGTIFLAELGDKTQLATLLYAADRPGARWLVFAAASLALVVAVGIAVAAGAWISQFVSEKQLKLIAGAGFIAIGLWTLRSGLTV